MKGASYQQAMRDAAAARSRSLIRHESSVAAILSLPFVVEYERLNDASPIEPSPKSSVSHRRKLSIVGVSRRLWKRLNRVLRVTAPNPSAATMGAKAPTSRANSVPLARGSALPAIAGHVERFDASGLIGWALDPEKPETPVAVSLYIDGQLAASGLAASYRRHLADYGIGEALCGFDMPVPRQGYYAGREAKIFARAAGADILIGSFDLQGPRFDTGGAHPVVHIDISDLVKFLAVHKRVSGIQRFQIGMIQGLSNVAHPAYTLEFCARRDHTRFKHVTRNELRNLLESVHSTVNDARAGWQTLLKQLTSTNRLDAVFKPSDALLALGAPWSVDNHSAALRLVRSQGVRYFQVLYDIVPIAMPAVVDANFIGSFVESTSTMLANADHIFSISDFSRSELEAIALNAGVSSPRCDVIRLGDTLTDASPRTEATSAKAIERTSHDLGIHGEFVLCVGTIEPRKNLAFLRDVWAKLCEDDEQVRPQLVLVGRLGWNMGDFLGQLAQDKRLGRRIVHVEDASDDLLAELYDRCLFTIFPSLYEGWGLPIIESFSHGKLCVCSGISAMPEAGRDLAVYIDPHDVLATVKTIEGLLSDRAVLQAMEDRVRADFVPVSWKAAAAEFSEAIGAALAEPPSAPGLASPTLRMNVRHFVGMPPADIDPARQFGIHLAQSHLTGIFSGTHWYELEPDRRWACGPCATIEVRADGPASSIIIELSVAEPLVGTPCAVHIDGVTQGTFVPARGYVVLYLSLPERDHSEPIALTLIAGVAVTPQGTDTRLLSFGVLSIMICDQDGDAAFMHFLRAERHDRNVTLNGLKNNAVRLGVRGSLV